MNVETTARRVLLALTAVVAIAGVVAALALPRGTDAAQAQSAAPMAMNHSALLTRKSVALRQNMRKLWEDHITWTRLAIISLESGTPDTNATVGRLLKNQTDIGNAIKPFYGKAVGNALTKLLREHILIAADLIAAAKNGDNAKLAEAQARWFRNADQIAAALHRVNPRYWKLAAMKADMHRHLELTTQEAVARLHGDWTADVAAYEKVHRHILHMSDMLWAGIVKQFPARFR